MIGSNLICFAFLQLKRLLNFNESACETSEISNYNLINNYIWYFKHIKQKINNKWVTLTEKRVCLDHSKSGRAVCWCCPPWLRCGWTGGARFLLHPDRWYGSDSFRISGRLIGLSVQAQVKQGWKDIGVTRGNLDEDYRRIL